MAGPADRLTEPAEPAPWSVTLPGAKAGLHFRPADPAAEADVDLLHDWLHRPHVAPWWGPDRDRDETRAYLARQRGSGHLVPWIVSAVDLDDGRHRPFGYTETYRPADDPLADWFPVRATDQGWHVLVGPDEAIGSGLPRLLGRAVLAHLFSDPTVERVICEPNELNTRMHGYCKALGYDVVAAVDLPDKRALILACTRATFEARWPGDLDALTRDRG
ncbi:MAG TPA: GNAT family N-acetyltransferase [Acidimicrobiales bacterium]